MKGIVMTRRAHEREYSNEASTRKGSRDEGSATKGNRSCRQERPSRANGSGLPTKGIKRRELRHEGNQLVKPRAAQPPNGLGFKVYILYIQPLYGVGITAVSEHLRKR